MLTALVHTETISDKSIEHGTTISFIKQSPKVFFRIRWECDCYHGTYVMSMSR